MQVGLTGFIGAPGVNTWHWSTGSLFNSNAADDIGAALRDAYIQIAAYCRDDLTFNFQPFVDILDEDSGQLIEVINLTNFPPAVNGNGSGDQVARFTMLKAQLRTTSVVNGRFVRGGCFLGPVAANAMDSSGAPLPAARVAVAAAIQDNLIDGPLNDTVLGVYKRPVNGTGGKILKVTSADVSTKMATLRSRRD